MQLGDDSTPDVVIAPLYRNESWDSPEFKTYVAAERQYALIATGLDALEFQCSFDNTDPNGNTSDTTIGFGGHADVQEHCNLFIQYYRKDKKDSPVTCIEVSGGR